MYLMSRPRPARPNAICKPPARRPSTTIEESAVSIEVPPASASMTNAESTAAAGAHGAVMSRLAPPSAGATRPSAVAPRIPASAPVAFRLA